MLGSGVMLKIHFWKVKMLNFELVDFTGAFLLNFLSNQSSAFSHKIHRKAIKEVFKNLLNKFEAIIVSLASSPKRFLTIKTCKWYFSWFRFDLIILNENLINYESENDVLQF